MSCTPTPEEIVTALTGPQGPAGPEGEIGPQGPIGNNGQVGPQGPIGATGDIGPIGPTGNDGNTGPQGPSGADGATGPQGPQGPVGPQGPEGNDGIQGVQGFQGATGATGSQGPTGPQGPPGTGIAIPNNLLHWYTIFTESPTTAKVAYVGDSTADFSGNAIAFPGYINKWTGMGQLLQGFDTVNNMPNFGTTGNTLYNFINFPNNAKGMNALIAFAPDLIIFGYGINDVRTNSVTLASFKAMLATAISTIVAALPNVSIILKMPNSFQINDPGSHGYVVQGSYPSIAAAAQAQSDILYRAYYECQNLPNCVLFNQQDLIFGRTCQLTSGLMTDQIHPQYADMVNMLVTNFMGLRAPFSPALSVTALATNYTQPYTVYPRALEDTSHYVKLIPAIAPGGPTPSLNSTISPTSVIFRINCDAYAVGKIFPNDIVNLGDTYFFTGCTNSAIISPTVIQLTCPAGSVPANSITSAALQVYRPIYNNVQAAEPLLKAKPNYVRRCKIIAGTTTSFTLGTALDDALTLQTPGINVSQYQLSASDNMVIDGTGVFPLTGATFTVSGNNLQVNLAGTWSGYVGKVVLVVGNHIYGTL